MPKTEASSVDFVALALDQHQSGLIRYATSILGDVERAREVVQDTFLKLCQQRPSKLKDHVAQWLFTVCRNRAFDVRKREQRTQPLTVVDLETRPGPGPRPLEMLEREEVIAQVLEFVEGLPEREREVITLKFQCELSYKEISAVTDLSVSNVGFLIHNGMKRVRSQIKATSPSTPSTAPVLARRSQ
jgi:RNA polymerase sigma factor (sigma-70 family)